MILAQYDIIQGSVQRNLYVYNIWGDTANIRWGGNMNNFDKFLRD